MHVAFCFIKSLISWRTSFALAHYNNNSDECPLRHYYWNDNYVFHKRKGGQLACLHVHNQAHNSFSISYLDTGLTSVSVFYIKFKCVTLFLDFLACWLCPVLQVCSVQQRRGSTPKASTSQIACLPSVRGQWPRVGQNQPMWRFSLNLRIRSHLSLVFSEAHAARSVSHCSLTLTKRQWGSQTWVQRCMSSSAWPCATSPVLGAALQSDAIGCCGYLSPMSLA